MTDRERALWDAALAFVGGRYWPPHDPKAIARALLAAKAEVMWEVAMNRCTACRDGWPVFGAKNTRDNEWHRIPGRLDAVHVCTAIHERNRAADYAAAAKGGGDADKGRP